MTLPLNVARALLRDATRSIAGRRGFNSATAVARRQSPLTSSASCTHDRFRRFSTAAHVDDAPQTQSPTADGESPSSGGGGEDSPAGTQPPLRKKISSVKISEVLKRKHTLRWVEPVISKDATVREAITVCIERKLNGMMVVDRSEGVVKRQTTTELKQKCVGLITSRDILRMMASRIKDGGSPEEVLGESISAQMTPIDQVIYGRPDETIGMCRAIMTKLGIKCLPILSGGRVEGILTARDMADFHYDPKDKGGKKNYLRDVSERVGLTADTSMAEPPVFVRQHLALRHPPLYMNVGVVEYPHPYKTADGIGSSRRNFGPRDLATDPDLSEDAHFVSEVELLNKSGSNMQKFLYMGVADGVGSWREYGVDPRQFSHKLMEGCEDVLREASSKCVTSGGRTNCSMIPPAELLAQSYVAPKKPMS